MGLLKNKKKERPQFSLPEPQPEPKTKTKIKTKVFDQPWRRQRAKKWLRRVSDGYGSTEREEFDLVAFENPEANLILSSIEDHPGFHAPVLDCDFSCELMPSNTEGHFHLYINKPMSWDDYVKLLTVMDEVGLLEHQWVKAAIKNEYSAVRCPGVLKYEMEKCGSSLTNLLNTLK